MTSTNSSFRDKVYELVAQIPEGRVMTYGQIAALCGSPQASRIVGGIAHFGPADLPWQRVVMKNGRLAAGFPGGKRGHAAMLKTEGVGVSDDYRVDIDALLWWPE